MTRTLDQVCGCAGCSSGGDLPLGIKAVEKGCVRGHVSLERKNTLYKVFIFFFTYWMYTSYKMTRRPFSVVKIALCPSCAGENFTIGGAGNNLSSSGMNSDMFFEGWPPFNNTNGKTLLGSVDYSLVFSHAVGLFISGYIADRVNLRYFICIGMVGSSITAVFLGLGYFLQIHHLSYFIVFQILAGLLHSTGWPGLQGVTAKWFGKKNRGMIIGLWSSCSFAGSIMGYVVPSFFILTENEAESPWGWSFITPALITMVTAVVAFFVLVPDPELLGLDPPIHSIETEERKEEEEESSFSGDNTRLVTNNNKEEEEEEEKEDDGDISTLSDGPVLVRENGNGEIQPPSTTNPKVVKSVGFIRAFLIPGVIEYSLCLFGIKLITYSFDFWLPFYISVSYPDFGGRQSAWLATLFNFGGIAGGLIIGVLSDRITSSRSIIIVPVLMLGVPTLLIFRVFGGESLVLYGFLVFLIGVFINGPHIIIVGAVSNDLGTHKSLRNDQNAKSIVSGIIDGTGAVGAAIGPLLVGVFTDRFGWDSIFYLMMVTCFLSALLLSRLLITETKAVIRKCKTCVNSGSYNVMTSQHSSGAEEETAELVEMDELETEMGLLGDDDATVSD